MDVLEESLKKLKLPTLSDRLDGWLETAAKQEWGDREFLEKIVAEEVTDKSHKRTEMGVRMARFPFVKTVEGFDFESQPSLDPKRIRELATSRWVATKYLDHYLGWRRMLERFGDRLDSALWLGLAVGSNGLQYESGT